MSARDNSSAAFRRRFLARHTGTPSASVETDGEQQRTRERRRETVRLPRPRPGDEHSDLEVALIVPAGARARRYELYDRAFDIGQEHGLELASCPRYRALAVAEVLELRRLDHERGP